MRHPDDAATGFIQPGSPWQNSRVQNFFGKLREEFLNREALRCGEEVQKALDEHMDHYNHHRLQRSLKGLTPSCLKGFGPQGPLEEIRAL